MAFCSKCGAQIYDGAQFCPKCGQPNNAASQQHFNQQQYGVQPKEEHSRMYKMWHSKWNWGAAIVLFFIFVAVKIGNASDEVVEETSVTSSISSDVAQQGYEDGYQAGFQLADMDMQPDAKIAFTTNFGAPSTPEEKEMYNIYKQNYDKGYREGKSAGRE